MNNIALIKELATLYGAINDHLWKGEDEYVDNYLQSIDMVNTDTVKLVGFARLTYMYKDRLPYWKMYVKLGYEEVKSRGENADEIYRGLINYVVKADE